MIKRPLYSKSIINLAFHHNKMAFVSGPRQVGKTTMADQMMEEYRRKNYYTWDDVTFRRQWIKDPKVFIPELVDEKILTVFDELHKAPRWKVNLKGLYDQRKNSSHILVTGSAKLDIFRRGGESLLGRYFLFRMHPLTIGELLTTSINSPNDLSNALKKKKHTTNQILDRLLHHGGFPEPYLKSDDTFTNLWRRTRVERLVKEDLIDLSRAYDVALIESLVALLPERVGSLFSYQSLSEDLEVAHGTIKRWMRLLSQLFYVYEIKPYQKSITRSLKKQPKMYLWDWSEITDQGARFENLVAGHLLKAIHYWTDTGQGTFDLYFIRDKDKNEVDFLITQNRKPWMLIECKQKDATPSLQLKKFAEILMPEITLQVVEVSDVHEWFPLGSKERGQIISASAFLSILP